MKSIPQKLRETLEQVILCARMWIEIGRHNKSAGYPFVILCARMWIEINIVNGLFEKDYVILCARMWIEMFSTLSHPGMTVSHPLCEDVD